MSPLSRTLGGETMHRLRAALPLLALVALAACGDGEGADVLRTSPDVAPGATAEEDVSHDPRAEHGSSCVTEPGAVGRRYRVAPGDTLRGIALRVYGDADLWRELLRANPDLVGEDGAVRAGSDLVVPMAGR